MCGAIWVVPSETQLGSGLWKRRWKGLRNVWQTGWLLVNRPPASKPSKVSGRCIWQRCRWNCRLRTREAVLLRHWYGRSLAEIAGELCCTHAAVAGLLHRGLKNLRKQLHEWE